MTATEKNASLLASGQLKTALIESLRKLNPKAQLRNPVRFVVFVGSIATTLLAILASTGRAAEGSPGFVWAISAWLWFTVIFANLAEALAEGRGKAQADALKATRRDVLARKLEDPKQHLVIESVAAATLRKGDFVYIVAGDTIPGDGEIIEGIASVDESAVTGESAPVIREAGGDRSAVTGGTRVLSDWIVVRIAANPGESGRDTRAQRRTP